MQITRTYPLYVILTSLVVGVATLGGCDSCRGEPEDRLREPLSLIPAEAILVATAEIRPIIATDAYKRIRKNYNPVSQYLGDCDYDPMPHIDRVWIGSGEEYIKGRGVMVVIGPVNRDKVLECYRADVRRRGLSVEEEEIEGFTVYSAGPGRLHLAWLDAETVVVGDRANTVKVLELERGKGKSVRTNQALFNLWQRVANEHDTAIALLPDQNGLDHLGKILPGSYQALTKTEQAAVAFNIRKEKGMDLEVVLRLNAGDEAIKVAEHMTRDLQNASTNEYVSIAGIDEHIRAINLEQAGPEITATAHWTERQLNSLASLAVDSIDEIMRSGDPEKALRERFGPSKNDAGSDGGNDAASDAGPAKTAGDAATPTNEE